jgi:aspartate aminotransferase
MTARKLLSKRMAGIQASPMLALVGKTAELKAAGRDIIGLAAGEPDFETPIHIRDAAEAAMARGQTRYTAVDGTRALKEAIADKFRRENKLSYAADEITVGTGGKQVIYNALTATVDPGDEVVISLPAYPSYAEITRMCGGTPVEILCSQDSGFKLTPGRLAAALTARTKWLILNSPGNPSGAVYTRDQLRALASVLVSHPNVWVLTDDIYEHLVYRSEPYATIAEVEPRLQDRTLIVNGVSKAYCMTGWRIGYGGGPAALISAMNVVQSQCTSNPSSIGQAGALAALTGPQDCLAVHRVEYMRRRDRVVQELNASRARSCLVPDGAFYAFPSCQALEGVCSTAGVFESDVDVAKYLLDEAGVVVVPGSAFGAPWHLRLSFALDLETLVEGCRRIRSAVETLTRNQA